MEEFTVPKTEDEAVEKTAMLIHILFEEALVRHGQTDNDYDSQKHQNALKKAEKLGELYQMIMQPVKDWKSFEVKLAIRLESTDYTQEGYKEYLELEGDDNVYEINPADYADNIISSLKFSFEKQQRTR